MPALFTLTVILGGCGSDKQSPYANGQGRAMGRGSPARPPVPIAVARAEVGSIASYYTATGTLEVEKQAEVLARVTGIVQSLEVEEGDEVDKGSRLLQIENDEYQYQLTKSTATAENLRTQYDRISDVKNLVSIEEFEALKNNLATADAEEAVSNTQKKQPTTTYE